MAQQSLVEELGGSQQVLDGSQQVPGESPQELGVSRWELGPAPRCRCKCPLEGNRYRWDSESVLRFPGTRFLYRHISMHFRLSCRWVWFSPSGGQLVMVTSTVE